MEMGINRGNAQAAAHQDDCALQFADVAGQPQGPDEIEEEIALPQAHHLKRGLPHGLDDHCDSTPACVEIRHSEWDALAVLVNPSHHEVSGPRRPRHIRSIHVPKKCRWTKLTSRSDEKHYTPKKVLMVTNFGQAYPVRQLLIGRLKHAPRAASMGKTVPTGFAKRTQFRGAAGQLPLRL
jgi:hypothetical protein